MQIKKQSRYKIILEFLWKVYLGYVLSFDLTNAGQILSKTIRMWPHLSISDLRSRRSFHPEFLIDRLMEAKRRQEAIRKSILNANAKYNLYIMLSYKSLIVSIHVFECSLLSKNLNSNLDFGFKFDRYYNINSIIKRLINWKIGRKIFFKWLPLFKKPWTSKIAEAFHE